MRSILLSLYIFYDILKGLGFSLIERRWYALSKIRFFNRMVLLFWNVPNHTSIVLFLLFCIGEFLNSFIEEFFKEFDLTIKCKIVHCVGWPLPFCKQEKICPLLNALSNLLDVRLLLISHPQQMINCILFLKAFVPELLDSIEAILESLICISSVQKQIPFRNTLSKDGVVLRI